MPSWHLRIRGGAGRFDSASGGFIREMAECPVGKLVLGGGAQVVGEGTDNFRTLIRESTAGTATIGGDTVHGWLVALENGYKESHTIGIFANCATVQPNASGYEVVREDYTVPAGGFIREPAECPVGKVVLGGGAQVVGEGTSDFKTLIRESVGGTVGIGGGAQDLWLVALQNDDKVSHTIGIFAICATNHSNVPGYEVVQQNYTVPADGFIRETAECPAGKVVLGGDAQVVGEGTKDFKTVIRESVGGTVGGGAQYLWLVALQNNDSVSHTIGIFAFCADIQ